MQAHLPSGRAKRLLGGPLPPLSMAAPQCSVWASAGGHVEKGFPHCSQRGLCFMMPHSIGSHYLPRGQRQFLFHGEQWMMVSKREQLCMGGKTTTTTTTKQLLVTKTNSKYGHSYEASGRKAPIVPDPLCRQAERKVGGSMLVFCPTEETRSPLPGEVMKRKGTCAPSE